MQHASRPAAKPKTTTRTTQSLSTQASSLNSVQSQPTGRLSVQNKAPTTTNSTQKTVGVNKSATKTTAKPVVKKMNDPFSGPISLMNGLSMNYNKNVLIPQALSGMYAVIDSYRDAEGYQIHNEYKKLHASILADDVNELANFIAQCGNDFKVFLDKNIDNDDNNIFHIIFYEHFSQQHGVNSQGKAKCTAVFEYIVKKYSKFINSRPNYKGQLPTHFIGNFPWIQSLELVLRTKIKITHINQRTNENIAHYFAQAAESINDHPEIFQQALYMFLIRGVKLNVKSLKQKKTPLEILIQHKNPDVVNSTKRVFSRYNKMMVLYLLQHEMKDKSEDKVYKLRNLNWEARANIISMLSY